MLCDMPINEARRRVAIVTGASRGLGRVIAGVLAGRGTDVVIGGRDADALLRTADALAGTGSRVHPVPGDVTDANVRSQLVSAARDMGGLDLLINNASELGPIGPLMQLDVTRLGRIFPVNAGAPLALIQLAVPLLAVRRGLIVNITSDAALAAYPGWGAYGASKAALELITRTLAVELRGVGVSAVVVDPGDMRTQMQQAAYPDEDISDRPLPEVTIPFWKWLLDQNPEDLRGLRLAAQRENARWLQPA
jgi:NAD(P)-dependent dehydrogenase (short-subunit alcohol dehydrogenase family)